MYGSSGERAIRVSWPIIQSLHPRFRVCQQLGYWLEDNFSHGEEPGHEFHGNQHTESGEVLDTKTSAESDAVIGMKTKQKDLKLGVSTATLAAWRMAATVVGEKELDEWLEPFTSGTDKEGNPLEPDKVPELTFATFQDLLRSKSHKEIDKLEEKHKAKPQITDVMQAILNDANAFSDAMAIALEVIPKGEIPDAHLQQVHDRLIRLLPAISHYLEHADLGNKVQPWEKKNCGGLK